MKPISESLRLRDVAGTAMSGLTTSPSRHRKDISVLNHQVKRACTTGAMSGIIIYKLQSAPLTASSRKSLRSPDTDWLKYLAQLREEPSFPAVVINTASRIWKLLVDHRFDFPRPHAYPTEEGSLTMSWIGRDHSLKIEIFESSHIRYFFRDRSAGERWSITTGDPDLPPRIQEILPLFNE